MTVYLREDVEFVKSTPKKYPARSTIQHWQLRDLIACPLKRSEFIFVNQNNIQAYNTINNQTLPVFSDLTFAPTSMAAGQGYIAAGGQRSQLVVKSLVSMWEDQATVGGSINNAISISNHGGSDRILICNNDETIKIFSLPQLSLITTLQLPTAVNYAAVSPDGRKLLAVGDSPQVFLYNISPQGHYTRISTMTASNDAGFSCAWNQSSDKFAVASQDGCVSVWDIRSTEKMTKLGSVQNPQVKGACRCVKFSPSGSVDLLMYSEHVSYVNFVDARTFNERQSIRVAPPGNDQHISGISFSPDSKSVFVGLESSVVEYDVDTLSRRSFPAGSII